MTNLIDDANRKYSSSKVVMSLTNKQCIKSYSLLLRNHESKLSALNFAKDMAETFSDFFVNKIMNIRKDLLEM